MSDHDDFARLLREVQAGDEEATRQFVLRYEPHLRRVIRVRLGANPLRAVLDSVDICQSVLSSFFLRASAGQFELHSPGQLLKLLETMAHRKLLNQAKKHQAQRRDRRRHEPGNGRALETLADRQPGPLQVVSDREAVQRARRLFSEEELFLMDRRGQGYSWAEIAQALGRDGETLRKQLSRAVDRVARQLGLEKKAAD